jgi:2-polyprenyl-3-methyl-5-hydroxy-6-metoxy-1,4-benzoquinol methylase
MEEFECKICQHANGNVPYKVKEMMFGMRHEFIYFKCAQCGCLQISQIPKNISDYYPKEQYYSFASSTLSPLQKSVKKYLLDKLFNFYLGNFSIIGYWANKLYYLQKRYAWVSSLKGINKTARILDIGSGSGKYLEELYHCGFKNIQGMDPYIDKDITTPNGIHIYKQDISELYGSYDLIMLNHVFEHMDQPNEILIQLRSLLTETGQILIRVPLVDSVAWEKYGVHWYQIDAPRHFYLHTKKSMELLASNTDFEIDQIIYDSNDYQFIFSEQYQQNKIITDPKRFTKHQIKIWRKQAAQLNKNNKGDQACFILRPI